jgi:hypothetical protein
LYVLYAPCEQGEQSVLAREEKGMLRRWVLVIAGIAALSSFWSCQKIYYGEEGMLLNENWGRSFEAAKKNQILNPEASKNLSPVVGLDGNAADANMNSYRKRFEGAGAGGAGYEQGKGPFMIDLGGVGTQ